MASTATSLMMPIQMYICKVCPQPELIYSHNFVIYLLCQKLFQATDLCETYTLSEVQVFVQHAIPEKNYCQG